MAGKARPMGNSNLLAEVEVLVDTWGVTRRAAFALLKALKVPLLHMTDEVFFNMYALEKVVFYLSRHGGTGFSAPGSNHKNHNRKNLSRKTPIKVSITDDDLVIMESPEFIAEWGVYHGKRKK